MFVQFSFVLVCFFGVFFWYVFEGGLSSLSTLH